MVKPNWIDIPQNTEEWLQLRSGKVTGSGIGKIMANYGKAFGEPAKKYAAKIAVEIITGNYIDDNDTNAHMERGHEQEPIARALYEDEYFCEVTNGGFYDGGIVGSSPDGIVRNERLLEIKSVIYSVQLETIKRAGFDPKYKWQLPFNLKVSGLEWIDYASYCSSFPIDSQMYIKEYHIDSFTESIDKIRERLHEFFILVSKNIEIILNEYRIEKSIKKIECNF